MLTAYSKIGINMSELEISVICATEEKLKFVFKIHTYIKVLKFTVEMSICGRHLIVLLIFGQGTHKFSAGKH